MRKLISILCLLAMSIAFTGVSKAAFADTGPKVTKTYEVSKKITIASEIANNHFDRITLEHGAVMPLLRSAQANDVSISANAFVNKPQAVPTPENPSILIWHSESEPGMLSGYKPEIFAPGHDCRCSS